MATTKSKSTPTPQQLEAEHRANGERFRAAVREVYNSGDTLLIGQLLAGE